MASVALTPDVLDIVHYNQDRIEFYVTYRNGGDDSLFNFTGLTVVAQVKANKADSAAVLEFNTSDESITLLDSGTRLKFYKSTADVIPASPGSYVWDLEVRVGSDVFTLHTGSFVITQDVTR